MLLYIFSLFFGKIKIVGFREVVENHCINWTQYVCDDFDIGNMNILISVCQINDEQPHSTETHHD